MVKKIAAILLLLSGCVPLLFIIFFHIQQQRIHHKMEEAIEEHVLYSINVAEKKVHWIEKGKEIIIDGRMFDIKTLKFKDGVYTFTGLFDDEETLLVKQLEEKHKGGSVSDNKMMTLLFQWLRSVFNETHKENVSAANLLSQQFFISNKMPVLSQFISILTPPPRLWL